MYQNTPYSAPAYYGYYGAEEAAVPNVQGPASENTSEGLIDKFRGYAAMAHSSDIGAVLTAAGTAAYNFFIRDEGLLSSLAWGLVAWGGYRLATALIAGEALGSEPVFSLALLGAGTAFLIADSRGWLPDAMGAGDYNLFDDFQTEDWA